MRVLIIDNGSRFLGRVVKLVSQRYAYEVVSYDPDMQMSDHGFDVIIVSGGMVHEVLETLPNGQRYFEQQLDLIRRTQLPVLGLCLGHQMANVALGGSLKQLETMIETDDMPLSLDGAAREIFDAASIEVFKRHQWVVDEPATGFEVIAVSDHGVEMMRHTSRPIITTQFHPEFDTTPTSIFWDVFEMLEKPTRTIDKTLQK